jgi:hypothetical protein
MLRNLDRRLARATIALFFWSLYAQIPPPASGQDSETVQAEVERLETLRRAETDPDKREAISQQIDDTYMRGPRERTNTLLDAWQKESDPNAKRELGEELVDAAVESQQPDIVIDIATGGQFAEKQIDISQGAQPMLLRECILLPPTSGDNVAQSGRPYQWVIRRMTTDRIEVWLPDHGWLFDSQGELVNEAFPPRRDGDGRDWYGAFLPDGSWVTTDLWGDDKVLTFFSQEGKWLKEINASDLVPHKPEGEEDPGDGATNISTIGWCRCDAIGNGFVVSVGQGSGRGVAWVSAKGEHHLLEARGAPWKLCYPRDLERKGMYMHLYIPDDRGNEWFESRSASHGSHVGSPILEAPGFQVVIPDGETFGFWPNSTALWIGTKLTTWDDDPDTEDQGESSTEQTWFYEPDGSFVGWIAAGRLTDTPALDGMMFCDEEHRVISLGRDRMVQKIEQFVWPGDCSAASPYTLFPDLQLGFFMQGKNLVLARW